MKLITVEAAFSNADLEAAIRLFEAQSQAVRDMEGCTHYALYRSPTEGRIAILQHWETMAAFDAYRASNVFAALRGGLHPLMTAPPVTIIAEVDNV